MASKRSAEEERSGSAAFDPASVASTRPGTATPPWLGANESSTDGGWFNNRHVDQQQALADGTALIAFGAVGERPAARLLEKLLVCDASARLPLEAAAVRCGAPGRTCVPRRAAEYVRRATV